MYAARSALSGSWSKAGKVPEWSSPSKPYCLVDPWLSARMVLRRGLAVPWAEVGARTRAVMSRAKAQRSRGAHMRGEIGGLTFARCASAQTAAPWRGAEGHRACDDVGADRNPDFAGRAIAGTQPGWRGPTRVVSLLIRACTSASGLQPYTEVPRLARLQGQVANVFTQPGVPRCVPPSVYVEAVSASCHLPVTLLVAAVAEGVASIA
jgi:hypothetical protein